MKGINGNETAKKNADRLGVTPRTIRKAMQGKRAAMKRVEAKVHPEPAAEVAS